MKNLTIYVVTECEVKDPKVLREIIMRMSNDSKTVIARLGCGPMKSTYASPDNSISRETQKIENCSWAQILKLKYSHLRSGRIMRTQSWDGSPYHSTAVADTESAA